MSESSPRRQTDSVGTAPPRLLTPRCGHHFHAVAERAAQTHGSAKADEEAIVGYQCQDGTDPSPHDRGYRRVGDFSPIPQPLPEGGHALSPRDWRQRLVPVPAMPSHSVHASMMPIKCGEGHLLDAPRPPTELCRCRYLQPRTSSVGLEAGSVDLPLAATFTVTACTCG